MNHPAATLILGHATPATGVITTRELYLTSAAAIDSVGATSRKDAIEAAHREFDSRKNGNGAWRGRPQSERDATKAVAARLLARA